MFYNLRPFLQSSKMDKSCKFKKVFSKKGFQISCAPFYRGSKKFSTFLKISVDNPMAMWYDNRLGSGGASWFEFVKSITSKVSDIMLYITSHDFVKISKVVSNPC